jgi:hypothetical protein
VSKEIPILFSGAMVRAILEGRKTVTRRVIKSSVNQYHSAGNPVKLLADWPLSKLSYFSEQPPATATFHVQSDVDSYVSEHVTCPYGVDKLWVRETFMDLRPHQDRYGYKATDLDIVTKWRPSIFMPRSASRITLEVVSVRPERLHDITEDDAKAEGVWTDSTDMRMLSSATKNHVGSFARLWNEINEKRGYSWGSNPWIWRVEFKRV